MLELAFGLCISPIKADTIVGDFYELPSFVPDIFSNESFHFKKEVPHNEV
jgi:hypothetical protein